MRADQLQKMRHLQEKLAEVFFTESDPDKWPDMLTRDSRGDRYWHKKNASASLSIICRIENLLALRDGRASGDAPNKDDDNLDDEIKAATKEAEQIAAAAVKRAQQRSSTKERR